MITLEAGSTGILPTLSSEYPILKKMAYDQAMAIMAYSYAYDITGDNFYKNVVYDIYKFLKKGSVEYRWNPPPT